MDLQRLEYRQILQIGLTDAWAFFADPANLPRITPPELNFSVTSPLPARMHPGMVVSYTITPFGPWRLGWVTEISHVAEPYYFVDEQRFGPYRFWHHQHHFQEVPGGVAMTDIVHYRLRWEPFSRLAAGLVARRLAHIFDFRRQALRELFGPFGSG